MARKRYIDEIQKAAEHLERLTGKTVVATAVDIRGSEYAFAIDGRPITILQEKVRGFLEGDEDAVRELNEFLKKEGFIEETNDHFNAKG